MKVYLKFGPIKNIHLRKLLLKNKFNDRQHKILFGNFSERHRLIRNYAKHSRDIVSGHLIQNYDIKWGVINFRG